VGPVVRIGVLAQSELPKQLEPLIEAIFREQFGKLNAIVGAEKLTLVGSIEGGFEELACIAAIEEGLNLELAPLRKSPELTERGAMIKSKIHAILVKQPRTTELDSRVPDADLIRLCDIMVFAYDKFNLAQRSKFEEIRDEFLASRLVHASLEKLLIEVNCPEHWSPDADGEIYFEYITSASDRLDICSEIEIPERLMQQWANAIPAKSQ